MKWSEAPVGWSSPYCEDVWGRYCCLTIFSDCQYVPSLLRYSPSKLCDGARWRIFCIFLRPAFSASRMQQVSDLHSKFALRPHHVWKYGRHPICDGWDQARNKKRRTRMWANGQRTGRPAECTWRPLFNAAQFGCHPVLECRAVTLLRRKTRRDLHGCPKLPNRSQHKGA